MSKEVVKKVKSTDIELKDKLVAIQRVTKVTKVVVTLVSLLSLLLVMRKAL